jgi:hypothetical protein
MKLKLLLKLELELELELQDLGLQLRSEGGVHIDAHLLPLSKRYVLTYATPIANA